MSFPLEDGETGCQSPKLQSAERLHCLQHQLGKYHASAKHCFQRCGHCSAFGSSCALGLKRLVLHLVLLSHLRIEVGVVS